MKKKAYSAIDAFLALSPKEKEREYDSVDREFSREDTQPSTASQRKAWRKFQARRRGRGRPKIGEGAKVISLTIEGGLLKRADAFAKRRGVSRAQMVARGLELLMAS